MDNCTCGQPIVAQDDGIEGDYAHEYFTCEGCGAKYVRSAYIRDWSDWEPEGER